MGNVLRRGVVLLSIGDADKMRQRLAFLFLLIFATIYPAPSCRYDTYAQEPGDIVVDGNDGVAPLAVGDIAYRSLDDLIKAKSAGDFYFYADRTGTGLVEEYKKTYRYDYLLKDVADDGGYDAWFYCGCLIAYVIPDNGASYSWRRFVFSGELHKMSTGAWAVKRYTITFGLPGYTGTNVYGVTYDEGANFFEQYVAALQKDTELNGKTFNPAGQYDNYINWETHDTDAGGVNNLAEWVRGTAINDVYDDKPSLDPECKCGACCSCECVCGHWSGDACPATPDACACHQPKCTCADYCCYDKCGCEVCVEGEHAEHQNGAATCDGTIGDTIGFVGCSCHGDDAPEKECECANYCCYHTCECEKCAGLPAEKHSQHQNGSPTCDETDGEDGCECHETDDPENPENPDEEECACAKYCCYHTCKCERCAGLPAASHSQHKNGLPTCDGTNGSGGCDCHYTENPEDKPCTCANYCCYHTCKCERCAALPAEKHSQHKNGSPTCNGTNSSGGCSCHTTTDEEEEDFDPPEQPDFEELKPEERKKFLSGNSESDPNSFSGALNRLRKALNDKFKIDAITAWFDADFSGDLPRFEVALPNGMGTIIIDFTTLKTYSDMFMLRSALAFGVFCFFISAVLET